MFGAKMVKKKFIDASVLRKQRAYFSLTVLEDNMKLSILQGD